MSTRLSDLADPFFEAASRDVLVIPECRNCKQHFFYPTVLCPHCHHAGHDWVEASGHGVIYSFTDVYRSPDPDVLVPYTVAIVELREGVRLMTNIVGAGHDQVEIGDEVTVQFGIASDGRRVPFFALSSTD
jgi:uncharacterized protein